MIPACPHRFLPLHTLLLHEDHDRLLDHIQNKGMRHYPKATFLFDE